MRATFKGFVRSVSTVQTITPANGGKALRKQALVLTIPGYEYQDRVIPDEHWNIEVLNDAIEKHNLSSRDLELKKVECTVFINSKLYDSRGEDRFSINVRLAEIKEL